jgi:hypothetical protein
MQHELLIVAAATPFSNPPGCLLRSWAAQSAHVRLCYLYSVTQKRNPVLRCSADLQSRDLEV